MHRTFRAFGGLVGGVLFAVIGYYVAFYVGKPIVDSARASESWPTAAGVVEHSEVATSRSDDGTTMYRGNVVYRYRVGDRELTAENVFFGDKGTSSNPESANDVVASYPKGAKVQVFYDPENPATAVLEPGARWQSYVIFGFGLVFLAVGGLMFGASLLFLLAGGLIVGGAMAGFLGGSSSSETSGYHPPAAPPSRDDGTAGPDDDGFDMG